MGFVVKMQTVFIEIHVTALLDQPIYIYIYIYIEREREREREFLEDQKSITMSSDNDKIINVPTDIEA